MASLATFGAGIITRPLGAQILGGYVDRHRRKPAMMIRMTMIGTGILLLTARLKGSLGAAWRAVVERGIQIDTPLGFSKEFFRHVDSHRRIYDMIVGRPSEITIERHMRRMRPISLSALGANATAGPGAVAHDRLIRART